MTVVRQMTCIFRFAANGAEPAEWRSPGAIAVLWAPEAEHREWVASTRSPRQIRCRTTASGWHAFDVTIAPLTPPTTERHNMTCFRPGSSLWLPGLGELPSVTSRGAGRAN